jgi:hypothetical protein
VPEKNRFEAIGLKNLGRAVACYPDKLLKWRVRNGNEPPPYEYNYAPVLVKFQASSMISL